MFPRLIFLLYSLSVLGVVAIDLEGGMRSGWGDVSVEELSMEVPKVDPFVSSEYTYRGVWVDDSGSETRYSFHNRVRVYTEDGVREWSKVDIPYHSGWQVSGIRARIIYPNGKEASVRRRDIYDRAVLTNDRLESSIKSFSFPGLRVGCIIEYKWDVLRVDKVRGFDIFVREEWPTWEYELEVKPNKRQASLCRGYNCNSEVEKKGNLYVYRDSNLRGRPKLPYLEARKNYEPFVYLEYGPKLSLQSPQSYWSYRGGLVVERNKRIQEEVSDAVDELADRLFRGVDSKEDRLRVAYDFCVEKVRNVSFDKRGISDPVEFNGGVEQTVLRAYGTRYDINVLFVRLAVIAGFEAGLAEVENQREFSYRHDVLGAFNISDWIVVIKEGERWRFFDPGNLGLPFEVLRPEHVNVHAIVADGDYFRVVKTGRMESGFSEISRFAFLSLNLDGDLEGLVKVVYGGYAGLWRKQLFEEMTFEERVAFVLDGDWRGRFSGARVDDFRVLNVEDREADLILSYRIKLPEYADRVGQRIFMNPSVFEAEKKGLFAAEEREVAVAFEYEISLRDRVSVVVPESFRFFGGNEVIAEEIAGTFVNRLSQTEFGEDKRSLKYQSVYSIKGTHVDAANYTLLKGEMDASRGLNTRLVCFQVGSGEMEGDKAYGK